MTDSFGEQGTVELDTLSHLHVTEGRSVRGSEIAIVARYKTAVVAGNQTYECSFRQCTRITLHDRALPTRRRE